MKKTGSLSLIEIYIPIYWGKHGDLLGNSWESPEASSGLFCLSVSQSINFK